MPAQQRRVLVVDDDATIRALLGSILRRRDLEVDEAADGQEALDLLRQNSYAVVLLDLLMPNVDGFGVLDEFGSAISTPVVLVITGADRSLIKQLDPQTREVRTLFGSGEPGFRDGPAVVLWVEPAGLTGTVH